MCFTLNKNNNLKLVSNFKTKMSKQRAINVHYIKNNSQEQLCEYSILYRLFKKVLLLSLFTNVLELQIHKP